MDHEIKKSITLDPELKNPFESIRGITCRTCKKPISEEELNDAIIVNAGMSVEDTFFSEKRSYYYHKGCYKEIKKE